jgi:hypothetical protein
MSMKKKVCALGLFLLSFNLGAEAPSGTSIFFGATQAIDIQEALPVGDEVMCTGNPDDESTDCWASYKAVLTATLRRVHRHGLRA